MSNPFLTPPLDGNQTRAPQILAVYWVQGGISILIVALRFYVRYIKRIIGSEDWAMLACLVLYITGAALVPVLIHYGVGRHIYYVPVEHLAKVEKWNWIIQPFGILAQPCGKASVTFFLLKLLPPNVFWRKWYLWVNLIIFTIMAVLSAIFSFVQCNPPRALWEFVPGSKCWNPNVQADFAIAAGAFGAYCDFALSFFPIAIFWNLKIDIRRKVGLYMLLGASAISGIAASLKVAQLRELANRTDVTWATFSLYAWGSTEIFVNILCGSLPTFKPLYDKWASGRNIAPSKAEKYKRTNSYELKDSNDSNFASTMEASLFSSKGATLVSNGSYSRGGADGITVIHEYDVS